MSFVLDTVILVDYLNGHTPAQKTVEDYEQVAISVISWIEVMAGTSPDDESVVRTFLDGIPLLPVTPQIAERTAAIRRTRQPRLKLPDAIILATAQELDSVLVTRNIRDFPPGYPDVIVPYQL